MVKEFGAFLFYCVLAEKSITMKQTTFSAIAVLLLLLFGCGLLDTGESRLNKHRSETLLAERHNKGASSEDDKKTDTAVFITAVEFAPSYFWQRDTAGDNEPFRINVYKNMEKIFSIDGGPGTNISYAPDMHRYIDGHLYTDWSSGSETVICRDGEEIIRFKGREMICGFLVKDGQIYTLSQNRDGAGFTWRCNGETLFHDSQGYVIGGISDQTNPAGAVSDDGGNLYFAYQIPSKRVTEQRPAVFLVENDASSPLRCPYEMTNVSDVRVIDGKIYISGNSGGYNAYAIMLAGDDEHRFYAGGGCYMAGCKALWSGKDMYMKTDYSRNAWYSSSALMWDMNGNIFGTMDNDKRVFDYYAEDDGYAYIGIDYSSGGTFVRNVQDDENVYTGVLPKRYNLMDTRCAALYGGTFYAGLTSHERGGVPVLVKNSVSTELKINGFISSVTVTGLPK